jgi:hypothetical protein
VSSHHDEVSGRTDAPSPAPSGPDDLTLPRPAAEGESAGSPLTARPSPEAGPPGPVPAGQGLPEPAPMNQEAPGAGPLAGPGDVPPGPAKTPWRAARDGKTVFRREAPFIFFWIWIAFVIFNVIEVIIPDHDYFSAELAVALLSATGIAYACGFRPRVIADDDGLLVRNPLRDHLIRWGGLSGIFLRESMELTCSRPAKKDKTIYCWALYVGRGARRRKQGGSLFGSMRTQRSGSSRLPEEVRELAEKDPVELMAAELGSRLDQARRKGAAPAALESRTAWIPVALIVLPALAFAALLLAG